jgi:hypothetical protein
MTRMFAHQAIPGDFSIDIKSPGMAGSQRIPPVLPDNL